MRVITPSRENRYSKNAVLTTPSCRPTGVVIPPLDTNMLQLFMAFFF